MKTGQVTYAVRDTHIDDKEIHEGDIMGIGDAWNPCCWKRCGRDSTKEMVAQMVDEDQRLISIYYGEDVQRKRQKNFAGD